MNIVIGLLTGALNNFLLVAPKLRVFTEVADDLLTITESFARRLGRSSSLMEDINRVVSSNGEDAVKTVTTGRFELAGVAVAALLLAMDSGNKILSLVSNAWAGFGAAFGPLVLFCLYKKDLTEKAALWGIVIGAATVLF